jgi:hypothetical protein
MFEFNVALQDASKIIDARKATQRQAYVLYYSNNPERYDGKINGVTIKSLINEFRGHGRNYKFAIIARLGDNKPLRYYNGDKSRKFFSLTRTRKSR